VLRGRLTQRLWAPTSCVVIPSVLKSADCLMVWLAERPDPGRAPAVALRAELAALRREFRRDAGRAGPGRDAAGGTGRGRPAHPP